MKILFLCHRFPYPPDHGARIRAFNFIRHLGQRHSVTVGTLALTQQELSDGRFLNDVCQGVIAEVVPTASRWLRAIAALSSSEPSSAAYFRSPALQARLDASLKAGQFDVIIVFCAFMAQYVVNWKQGYRILDYGDIDSAKWAAYSCHKGIPVSLGYGFEARKLRRFERRIASHFHQCAVITQGEFEEFQRLATDVPCTIIPNGVDTDHFAYNGGDPKGSPSIVFVGRMDYFPNVDGISYFVKEIFPLIRQRIPKIQLTIVGSNPTKVVRDLVKVPNVSLTGYVPDVRCFIRNATISIAPLRIARGTQNKILECMAMGVPTIATPEAAKGVQCVPGRDLLVAGNPPSFANQVIQVIDNPQLRKRLAEAGRLQIEQVHTWKRSLEILDSILSQMPKPIDRSTAKPAAQDENCELSCGGF